MVDHLLDESEVDEVFRQSQHEKFCFLLEAARDEPASTLAIFTMRYSEIAVTVYSPEWLLDELNACREMITLCTASLRNKGERWNDLLTQLRIADTPCPSSSTRH